MQRSRILTFLLLLGVGVMLGWSLSLLGIGERLSLAPAAQSTPAQAVTMVPILTPTPAGTPTPSAYEATTQALVLTAQAMATAIPPLDTLLPPTATPYVITPTPEPTDILARATQMIYQTSIAALFGTPTPLPPNWQVATTTPAPFVATATATAANEATAMAMYARETAVVMVFGAPITYLTPTPVDTPLVVTPTPYPTDLVEQAQFVLALTAEAQRMGTPTPLPPNWVVATNTPAPLVATPTALPQNQATAAVMAAQENAIIILHGALPVYMTPTPTPLFAYLSDIPAGLQPTPTAPFPPALIGKILFLGDENEDGEPEAYMVNPDGSGLARLSGLEFYDRAQERDTYSPDLRKHAETLRSPDGKMQLHYSNAEFDSRRELTRFGNGTAWDASWSPVSDQVVFVANESGNDEIYVVQAGEWPGRQLTDNTWEWDHSPSWSPDGTRIVFSSNRDAGVEQLWVMNADGSGQQVLIALPFSAHSPVWVKYEDDAPLMGKMDDT